MVTEVFANLAATAGRARGMERLRTLVLPHPMETRSGEEIAAIAQRSLETIERLLGGKGT